MRWCCQDRTQNFPEVHFLYFSLVPKQQKFGTNNHRRLYWCLEYCGRACSVIITAWIMCGSNSVAQTMLWLAWGWMELGLNPVGEYSEGSAIRHKMIPFLLVRRTRPCSAAIRFKFSPFVMKAYFETWWMYRTRQTTLFQKDKRHAWHELFRQCLLAFSKPSFFLDHPKEPLRKGSFEYKTVCRLFWIKCTSARQFRHRFI